KWPSPSGSDPGGTSAAGGSRPRAPQLLGLPVNDVERTAFSARRLRVFTSARYWPTVVSTDSLNLTRFLAISRSDVTAGLLSQRTSGLAPFAIWRARSAARITSANRLWTFSRQSSTVTRAKVPSRRDRKSDQKTDRKSDRKSSLR